MSKMTFFGALIFMVFLFAKPVVVNADMPIVGVEADDYHLLSKELTAMIRFPELNLNPNEEISVGVRFELDAADQIRLIDVSGDSEFIKRHVWLMLNGKKLDVRDDLQEKVYYTTIRFRG